MHAQYDRIFVLGQKEYYFEYPKKKKEQNTLR